MQPPGAECKKYVHTEFKLSAYQLPYMLNNRENGAHAGCRAFRIMYPTLEVCRVHPKFRTVAYNTISACGLITLNTAAMLVSH